MKRKRLSKQTKIFLSYLSLLVGSFIFAISAYMFLIPAKLIPGGITGIASVVETLFNFPAQYTIIILNVPILLVAFFMLEKRFTIRTVLCILLISGFMELFSQVNLYKFFNVAQPLIAAIVSGFLCGLGMGLMLNANASSGGTEVISMLLKKKFKNLKISQLLLILNVIIMLIGSIMFLVKGNMVVNELIILLVCSIIQSAISSKSVDYILNGINSAVKFEIVTKKDQEICEAILKDSEYGITVLESKGAYFEEKSKMLICVVHKAKIPTFKRLIQENDPDAFVFTTNTREIMGKNFKNNI